MPGYSCSRVLWRLLNPSQQVQHTWAERSETREAGPAPCLVIPEGTPLLLGPVGTTQGILTERPGSKGQRHRYLVAFPLHALCGGWAGGRQPHPGAQICPDL